MDSELQKPSKKAFAGSIINYHIEKINQERQPEEKKLTQRRIAIRTQIHEKDISKIVTNQAKSPRIDDLVKIALSLQLSVKETEEVLSRASRALSSAIPLHDKYRDIIKLYSRIDLSDCDDERFLEMADEILAKGRFEKFYTAHKIVTSKKA